MDVCNAIDTLKVGSNFQFEARNLLSDLVLYVYFPLKMAENVSKLPVFLNRYLSMVDNSVYININSHVAIAVKFESRPYLCSSDI